MFKTLLLPLCATLLGAPALQAQHADGEMAAAPKTEWKAQTVCPVSGKAIDKESFTDYEGQRIYFCCEKCPKAFAEFPDKFLYAMYKEGIQPENVQTTCPVSGEALENHDNFVEVMNKRIYTCCGKCKKKVAADPAPWLDKLEGRKVQTNCPVMGGEVDKGVSTVVQGQKVYYCCGKCAGKFKADPDKYFAKLAEQKVVTEAAMTTCPVSGDEPAEKDVFVTYQGRRIHFCCDNCIKKFVKEPAKYLAAL